MTSSLNETSIEIFTEKAFLQGALLSGVVYGMEVTLFMMTFWHLARKLRTDLNAKQFVFLGYSTTIFILGTLFYASNCQFTQLAFISNRNIPGGPGAYEETMFSIPIDELGNVCAVMSTWFCDALLLWRSYVIYSTVRLPIWTITLFPILLFLGSFVMGLLFLLQVSSSSPWSTDSSINWTIPFFSLSLSLNIILTIAIVLRLLVFRRYIMSVLGRSHGSQYTSIAAMIVESAAIFSTFSLLFLIPFAMNNPLNEIFFQALSGVQIVATLLIIFRVAQGKSWETDTVTRNRATVSKPFTNTSRRFARGGRGNQHAMKSIHFTASVSEASEMQRTISTSFHSMEGVAVVGNMSSSSRTLSGNNDGLSVTEGKKVQEV